MMTQPSRIIRLLATIIVILVGWVMLALGGLAFFVVIGIFPHGDEGTRRDAINYLFFWGPLWLLPHSCFTLIVAPEESQSMTKIKGLPNGFIGCKEITP